MAFIAAKCSQCGANIQVDDSRESGFCTYCGAKFVTEKVVHNYVTNNKIVTNYEQTTNVNAHTVHIHNDEINRLFMVEEGVLVKYKGKLKKVSVPEGILEIGDGAFTPDGEDAYSHVEEVILPKSLTVIQSGAFDAESIISVVAPDDGNLRKIESNAFDGINVVVFLVPSTVAEIEKNAFEKKNVALFRESKEEIKRKFPNISDRIICGVVGLGEERGFSFLYTTKGAYIYNCKDYYRKRESDDDVGYPASLGGKKTVGYFGRYTLIPPIEKGVETLPSPAFENRWIHDCNRIKKWKIPNTVKRIEKGALICDLQPSIEFEEGTVLDFWTDGCLDRVSTPALVKAGAINPPKFTNGDFYDGLEEVVLTVDKNVKRVVGLYVSPQSRWADYYKEWENESVENMLHGIYKNGRLLFGGSEILAGEVAPGESKKFYLLPDWRFTLGYPDKVSYVGNVPNANRYEITVEKKLFGAKATVVKTMRKNISCTDDKR